MKAFTAEMASQLVSSPASIENLNDLFGAVHVLRSLPMKYCKKLSRPPNQVKSAQIPTKLVKCVNLCNSFWDPPASIFKFNFWINMFFLGGNKFVGSNENLKRKNRTSLFLFEGQFFQGLTNVSL